MNMIEICTVGGYNEVGKNMTAVNVDGEVVIFDMGIHLESYIKYTEDEDIINVNPSELIKVGAVPDITKIEKWKDKVKAIIPTHAHLDHIGAVPYLSSNYDAPILGTPFTIAVLKTILKDEGITIKNKIRKLAQNSIFQLSKNLKVEFINITHSTPQTVMVALHTKYGIILYANDFKFDRFPTLGEKPNYKRLKELGKKGVLCLIVDSTYSQSCKKTPSESVAKEMLKDVLLGTGNKGKAVFVTTFSSHIARLRSIVECGKKMNRKIVFLGRSLSKYCKASESVGIAKFSDVRIVKYRKDIKRTLGKMYKSGIGKYLVVLTGHQGEPKAALSRIVNGELGFNFEPDDHVIFSCKTIPTPTNIENRRVLEEKLKNQHVRIFTDIHVSGHAAREDSRDLIELVRPKHIIPAHGEHKMTSAMADLALEMGYKEKDIHVMKNGQILNIPS
ncbi:MAG TPA: RNase J family beta-CASP ribonuclease [Candidatus Woesearchaeota archaeon]|nr:RNase J family beta-CASP ribonuclease [Candidatus Woesearchaeota archaeon]